MIPYAHQTKAFDRFKDKPFGALFLEPGLGKSKIAIDIANYKFSKGEITGVLVICPKSLINNWHLIEIPKHSTAPGVSIPWKVTKNPLVFPKSLSSLTWFVCNVDAVITDKWVKAFRAFHSMNPNFMLIVDESTTVKTPDAQRTKRVWEIALYSRARYILSGTPITNSPLDIWAQAEILSPGIMGKNFFLFKQRYALHEVVRISNLRTVNKVVGYQNLEELSDKINKFAAIAKKKDCLDLPPKIYRRVPVMFTPEQAHHYNQLKEFALTSIDNQEFTAVNAISLINLLLQVCAGQIKNPDGTYTELPTNRIDLLSDLIEENPDKPLIWCSFVGAADAIEKAFPTTLMRIKRETPDAERTNILELYAKTQDKLGLLVSQSLMGRGHTILEGRNMIYYAQRFSVEQRVQSEDRPHRIGQDRSILVSELYTPDTVEEKVLKVLEVGQALADKVVRDKSTFREFIS